MPKPSPLPSPSPERQKLAEAIARAREVTARRAAAEATLQAATPNVYRRHDAVGAAEAAIAEAQEAVAGHLVDVAQGVVGEAPLSPREARERLASAEIALSDGRAERDAVKTHNEQFRHDASASLVKDAAIAVMHAELVPTKARLIAEADRLRRELLTVLGQLAWFRKYGLLLDKAEHRVLEIGLSEYPAASAVAAVRWDALLTALCSDAAATIP